MNTGTTLNFSAIGKVDDIYAAVDCLTDQRNEEIIAEAISRRRAACTHVTNAFKARKMRLLSRRIEERIKTMRRVELSTTNILEKLVAAQDEAKRFEDVAASTEACGHCRACLGIANVVDRSCAGRRPWRESKKRRMLRGDRKDRKFFLDGGR